MTYKKSYFTQIASNLKKVSQALSPFGICLFNHDITFGEGRIALLTDNEEFFRFYYKKEFPIICSNKTGRTLATGIYLKNNLITRYLDCQILLPAVYSTFHFHNSLHIVEREEDCQHLFSFYSNLDDDSFLYYILNYLAKIQGVLNHYKLLAKEMIIEAKKPKYQLSLPYSQASSQAIFKLAHNSQCTTSFSDTHFIRLTEQSSGKKIVLSARQSQCLKLIAQGATVKETAKTLGLSDRTVEHYMANIREAVNCRNVKELISIYLQQYTDSKFLN